MPPSAIRARAIVRKAESSLAGQGIVVPSLTTELDSGQDARVFNTTNAGIVVRVGEADRCEESEQALLTPAFRTGVVQVVAMAQVDDFIVTWKKRLDLNVEGFICRKYVHEDAVRLLGALTSLYDRTRLRRNLDILQCYPETAGLARAIRAGMPVRDLALEQNLGVTEAGNIVAFDL